MGSVPGKDREETRVWEDGERRGKGGNKEVAVSQSYAHRPCGGCKAEMATLQSGSGMKGSIPWPEIPFDLVNLFDMIIRGPESYEK